MAMDNGNGSQNGNIAGINNATSSSQSSGSQNGTNSPFTSSN